MSAIKRRKVSSLGLDVELRKILQKNEYSLNAVNNYGDSLLHVSASNGCTESVRDILKKNHNCNIDRKNKFGWTPLMQAVRANKLQTVEVLIEYGADLTQRNYLGTSILTLAAGISHEMFETIYKAHTSMLANSVHDDVTPLCVAAMRNDKKLFFKLLSLGLKVEDESVYTHLVMRQSIFPEIRALAKSQCDVNDYWNNTSDNISIKKESGSTNDGYCRDKISNNIKSTGLAPRSSTIISSEERNLKLKPELVNDKVMTKEMKPPNINLLYVKELYYENKAVISPNLIYNLDSWFAKSPNLISASSPIQEPTKKVDCTFYRPKQKQRTIFTFDKPPDSHTLALPLQRTHDIHSLTSKITDHSRKDHINLTFEPQFSPPRSPCLPLDFEDEDICGEDTPTPPHYKTPPRGMVLNSEQAKLVTVLKQFELAHHISTFLAEEVDMSLFLTLNDQDLIEIGIVSDRDRKALLAVVDAYTKHKKY
ncbi:uncharacterized protein LOC124298852 isoform X1 [Neodiprion virginianus]|uniref:uncharacterized protein LOC124298852 isoform X1 n=1 Tax=Neodiprion virginianus TaxID=2961670 RepID=UPI001EE6F1A1|nr:uncharacterized protein LOC124298852 isoform X1 [Neodiprion virginianus]XP_046607353.1 uncharacterized protein LOC124298852 isoform X1 [Neodiprion virginianus]